MASWKSRLHTMLLLTQKQGVGFDKGTPKSTDQNMYVCHSISKRYSINSFFYKDALNGEPFYICKCSWRLKSTKITQIFVLVKKYYLHGKICKSKAIAICFILLNVHICTTTLKYIITPKIIWKGHIRIDAKMFAIKYIPLIFE